MKRLITSLTALSFFCLFPREINATRCTAIGNGQWSSAATWSCGRVPANNDTLTIPIGITVNVDINTPTYSNMLITVNGTLNFDVGQKINMCPGDLLLNATGMLTGGNGGSKINICGTTYWNGPGPTGGPLVIGPNPLPVELLTFEGNLNSNGQVALTWSTASESNNNYFTVERSTNGLTFEEIARVNGNGTTSQMHQYATIDPSPVQGTNYYRLKQTDYNGHSETFTIIAVDDATDKPGCVMTVYPNPCVDQCHVTFSDCPEDKDGAMTVELIDANGSVVHSQVTERNTTGSFTMTIDETNNLKPGMYIVRGTSSKKSYQQKAVLK